MATASAAERTFIPLGEAVTELCWMTGAGEPVGSELSFGLSGFAGEREREGGERRRNVENNCRYSRQMQRSIIPRVEGESTIRHTCLVGNVRVIQVALGSAIL